MQRSLALSLLLSLTLGACGGGGAGDDPADAAMAALTKGNFKAALPLFDTALAALDAGSADHKDLAIARVEAVAHADGENVLAAVEAIGKLTPQDYGQLTQRLLQSKAFDAAAKVMAKGVATYPDDPEMKKLETKTVATIRSSGDAAGGNALDSLGYSGED